MYEQTVNVEKSNAHLLDYVKSQLEPVLGQIDGISTEISDDYRNYYTLACSDTYRFQVGRAVNYAVCEALSLGYKNVYVRRLLNVGYDSFYQNVLVNTICKFDSEYDKQFVSRIILDGATVCLDGYYNFKMSQVKRKWQEISKLVCDNSYLLADNELIIELLQYLLESLTSREQTVSLSLLDDDFVLCNKSNSVLNKLKSIARTASVEEEAMLNVICLKPSNLVVYYNKKPCKEFSEMCDALFKTQFIFVE